MTYLNNFTLPAELLEQITSEGLDFLPELVRILINAATQIDREKYLGAGHYERTPERRGHANGFKPKTIYISPSSPWENAYIESFIGKFRKECVDRYLFHTLEETRNIIEDWRRDYNHYRPHSALGYLTPSAFAAQYSQTPLPNQEDHIRV